MRNNIWTIVELELGIVSAYLPAMRPLLKRGKVISKLSLGSRSRDAAAEKGSEHGHLGRGLTGHHSRSTPDFASLQSTSDSPDTVNYEKKTSELVVLSNVDATPEEQV